MKNKTIFKRILSVVVCLVLITAIALTVTGCQKNNAADTPQTTISDEQAVKFTLVVVDAEGKEKTFDLSSTEKTVGAALLKEGLIEGEEGQYGLYVKTVDGITADYDKDGTYWAFYIGGEYATTGVDQTDIKEGETYTLKVEKG